MQLNPATALRILLVDDDELDRMSVIRALKKSALSVYEIEQATTAAEALNLAAKQHFDLILLDFRLPDQDGLDVLRQLRSGKFESVAVIMLSRYTDDAVAEHCFEAGAQDFLLKDEVNSLRLTRAVKQARQRYAIEDQLRAGREQLRQLSEHDPLTGLLNRRGFEMELQRAKENSKRKKSCMAVLLLDLDDFKSVNDSLGHDIGDILLVRVAKRLNTVVRDGDRLCRLGGDEFVILMQDFMVEEQPKLLADRIFQILQVPMELGNINHTITASVGIAVLSDFTDDKVDVLKDADVAMYQAKKNGRNQSCFYSSSLQDSVVLKSKMKYDLKNALVHNEFELYYQAQMSTLDGSLGGIEALIRWQHPTKGLLAPAAFLPIAEETGLIVEIGYWVLRNACRQLKNWQQRFLEKKLNLSVAVNLSAIQIRHSNLSTKVCEILTEYDLDPRCLELEITESALITDTRATSLILASLAEKGVVLSLDDFGTGYSSLDHLKLFPISVLKIDKGFISAVGLDAKGEKLLAAIIAFAKTLDMKVVAEGVETKVQAEFCTKHACDLLQGYYFTQPIPAHEFEERFLA